MGLVTDGVQAFSRVVGEESRIVVVLYRAGWGQTPRMEQTAIRNRAYEYGYDFVLFIPLDTPSTVPRGRRKIAFGTPSAFPSPAKGILWLS